MSFKDHFSTRAAEYARFRPHYPDELFAWLAGVAPGRRLALDVATGNGQAAVMLARHFDFVIATDASAAQLAQAEPAENVDYRVGFARESGLPSHAVDLVTVAQALHWLDRPAFYAEARRVLVPGGVVAAWCYSLMRVGPGVDELVDRFYHEVVGPYWPAERRHTEDGYRSLEFPFEEVVAPPFEMRAAMTLDELAGYLGTWSATQRYLEARGDDPVPALIEELRPHWEGSREVKWPVWMRVGRSL